MASSSLQMLLLVFSIFAVHLHASDPPLTLDYYRSTCPNVLEIVRREMECAVLSDPRNAALILRLHFHDCFVQGCDGSVLLDETFSLYCGILQIENFPSSKELDELLLD